MPDKPAWRDRPEPAPLGPPPPDVVAAWRRYLAAEAAFREANARLPQPGAWLSGEIPRPDALLAEVDALAAEEARLAVEAYSSRWWYGATDRVEAKRLLNEAVA